MDAEVGERIGAILKADESSVHLIGFGLYLGDEVPSEDARGLGGILRESNLTNPKLVMDDGQVVWGYECWWAPEEEIRERIDGREVIPVDMAAERLR